MSLKTDFYDGATGLNTQLDTAFDDGSAYVTTNLTALSTALKNNAAQGLTKFTVNVLGTGTTNSGYLRGNKGNNLLLKAFFAGIIDGLAAQNIYSHECSLSLNVADSVNTSVDFNFNFFQTP